MVAYPEHDKLKAVAVKTQAAGEFIEWLAWDKGIHLPDGTPPVLELLAEWMNIDRDALEREKLAMLASLAKDQP